MRVAIVSEYARPWPGGISEHVHHEASELARQRHDVLVVTGPGEGSTDVETIRLQHAIELTGNGARSRVSFGAELARLAGLLRRAHVEVVHVHAPLDPLLALAAVLASPVPVVGTFHASFAPSRGWDLLYRSPPARAAFRRLTRRIAVSAEAERSIARYFPAAYARVPNGVDVARFSPGEPGAARPPSLLFVGRPDPRKGLGDALEAFARVRRALPGARLVLAGVDEQALGRALRGVPRDGVSALGYVAPDAMPGVYRDADVVLAPAIRGESQGIVLLEAMASGAPPVASRIAGYDETIDDGADGVLVPPGAPQALAEAVLALLRDPAGRASLARAGRAKAERHGWASVGERVAAVLEEARRGD